MNMGNRSMEEGTEMVKVTISITRDTHTRIKDALGKDKKYRNKLAYFVLDGVDRELSIVEGKAKVVPMELNERVGTMGSGEGF